LKSNRRSFAAFAAKSAANFAQDDSGIQVAANLMMTAVFMSWQRV
jgi:hypothetical protein